MRTTVKSQPENNIISLGHKNHNWRCKQTTIKDTLKLRRINGFMVLKNTYIFSNFLF